MTQAIETETLTKFYGNRRGIENVGLSVPEGSIFGFLGPNGAGKTTTIRVLLGLLKADRGRARVFGRSCWKDGPDLRREIGYLPGDVRMYLWMTIRDALSITGQIRGIDLREKGAELTEYFGLDPTVAVRRMSRGMRQKLGLILALAHDPKLLVLDEPTAALDPINQDRLYQLLRKRASQGRTVFFSSHVLSEVDHLCDRVAIMRKGSLIEDAPLSEFRNRAPRNVTLVPESNLELPPFLDEVERDGPRIICRLTGTLPELLKWLTSQVLQDVTIGHPDLERLFRDLYRKESP